MVLLLLNVKERSPLALAIDCERVLKRDKEGEHIGGTDLKWIVLPDVMASKTYLSNVICSHAS